MDEVSLVWSDVAGRGGWTVGGGKEFRVLVKCNERWGETPRVADTQLCQKGQAAEKPVVSMRERTGEGKVGRGKGEGGERTRGKRKMDEK